MTIPSSEGATPVMAQWFALKEEQPDALLFFRMGDFFELFFSDAEAAANALDISLTSRGTHAGQPIPMCGVPVGTASTYLARLIKRGFRVAVAEQTEDPATRPKGQKGPLSRAIVRLITPGTLTEDELLSATQPNYILCIIPNTKAKSSYLGIAWIDISTGSFETTYIQNTQLQDLLARINPSEILTQEHIDLHEHNDRKTPLPHLQTVTLAQKELSALFEINSLSALGDFQDEEIIAGYELVQYIQKTQDGKIPQLTKPQSQNYKDILAIDPSTRSSLEILQNKEGQQQFTLFSSVSHTVTAPGARMLASWLSSPLTKIELIKKRQEGWIYLYQNTRLIDDIRQTLKGSSDISRALGRLSLGRGQPKDLGAIRDGLQTARNLANILAVYEQKKEQSSLLHVLKTNLQHGEKLLNSLELALEEHLPLKLEEGHIIQTGYDQELDSYRRLRDHSRQIIISLQQKYSELYQISSLKIRHNNQLGYIIEVTNTAASKLRERPELILRQGTANLTRFTTVELSELGEKILDANQTAATREKILFSGLIEQVLQESKLPQLANAMAMIDVLQSCATLYASQQWCIPTLTDDTTFHLQDARHPVVEAAIRNHCSFTPNSCNLSKQKRIMLLTGPNMAGKSTFLRQVALCVILAQSGLPVPAKKADIGIVDRLFSRVGASDDLARGRSTFMVEMTEAASILHQAGPRSLVVIDEIGRGTSTLDGLAIAWAILESLHNTVQCRTIFATHFHDLVQTTDHLQCLSPFTMKVQEWKGKIIFQYEVIPGAAEHSWGIHVAQLAGVPNPTLKRAQEILNHLESQKHGTQINLPLSSPTITETIPDSVLSIQKEMKNINLDEITPKKALDFLYQLKKHIDF